LVGAFVILNTIVDEGEDTSVIITVSIATILPGDDLQSIIDIGSTLWVVVISTSSVELAFINEVYAILSGDSGAGTALQMKLSHSDR
jgi:hypothetical protein